MVIGFSLFYVSQIAQRAQAFTVASSSCHQTQITVRTRTDQAQLSF